MVNLKMLLSNRKIKETNNDNKKTMAVLMVRGFLNVESCMRPIIEHFRSKHDDELICKDNEVSQSNCIKTQYSTLTSEKGGSHKTLVGHFTVYSFICHQMLNILCDAFKHHVAFAYPFPWIDGEAGGSNS